MNPKQINRELNEQIKIWNDQFQEGLRAKEMTDTSYFHRFKELLETQIKAYKDYKSTMSYDIFVRIQSYKRSDGSRYTESAEDARLRHIKEEAYMQSREDLLGMIETDLQAGKDAGTELEKHRARLKK